MNTAAPQQSCEACAQCAARRVSIQVVDTHTRIRKAESQ
jgi:hypothetical protein